jgi:hypothetical protein
MIHEQRQTISFYDLLVNTPLFACTAFAQLAVTAA